MSKQVTNIPYSIKQNGAITLFYAGNIHAINSDHINYDKIVTALKKSEFSKIPGLVDVAKTVAKQCHGKVTISNGAVYYAGQQINSTLTEHLLKMLKEGYAVDHLIKFLENLMQNPSNRAIQETYTFLTNGGMPITSDGCFIAYKAVRNDYYDIYSGTILNKIGTSPSVPRNMVDDEYTRDCSTGLHVGALQYVVQYGHFSEGGVVPANGNRLLLVKVNPKDVVSVPKYENHPKMRVCQYTVISEINAGEAVATLKKSVYNADGSEMCPDDCDCCDCCDEDDEHDESDYNDGYHLAEEDFYNDMTYGASLHSNVSDEMATGYSDGWNDANSL